MGYPYIYLLLLIVISCIFLSQFEMFYKALIYYCF